MGQYGPISGGCFSPAAAILKTEKPLGMRLRVRTQLSDQHQISLCNIDALSVREVIRIKAMITLESSLDILTNTPHYF